MQPLFHGNVERGPGPAEFPPNQIGEHHDQDMAAGVFGGAHVNRAHLQVRRFAGAESLLDLCQILVAVMNDLLGGSAFRQIGLDDVAAVQPRGFFQSRLVHR